jgi:hypothetical protein
VCFFLLLVLISPRLALLALWLFTNEVDRAFDGPVVPFIGLLFLPVTTLVYALVWDPGGLTGGEWFWVLLGLLIDITTTGGLPGARRRRQRREAY